MSDKKDNKICVFLKNAEKGTNKIRLPKFVIENWGRNFEMIVYNDHLKLIPIEKGEN